ncbi:DUF167 domain-containing protein [Thermosulfurimonas dismutans]|uniref:UPF0235 protein TDIS_1953 n=1 Tax=Thermosulfurimonas dismutans TaxID=999894 RepID=A0A179D1K9_9BACT|nr:DUF167 domain-containing protein [Thermosulfurimonas dismutans]OAQ19954.1 hypothetical protein TDIS_1953 [Thermosulfurimonas dismutans]
MLLKVHLQPGAKKTELAGFHGASLKIKVAAPPVEGKANRALIEFLSKKLGVRKKEIEMLAGEKARDKIILVHGQSPEEVKKALGVS